MRKVTSCSFNLFFLPVLSHCVLCSMWQTIRTKLPHPLHVEVKGRGKKILRSWLCLPDKCLLSIPRPVKSHWDYMNNKAYPAEGRRGEDGGAGGRSWVWATFCFQVCSKEAQQCSAPCFGLFYGSTEPLSFVIWPIHFKENAREKVAAGLPTWPYCSVYCT